MPRIPELPRDSRRLFARVERFVVECPGCGTINRAAFQTIGAARRKITGRKKPDRHRQIEIYNPITQRFRCWECRRTFVVGLLLYRPAMGHRPAQPYDTTPTWAQLHELRQHSASVYLQGQRIAGSESVNILVEQACSCVQGEGDGGKAVDSRCPVHGWEEQLTEAAGQSRLEQEILRLRAQNAQLRAEIEQRQNQQPASFSTPREGERDPLSRARVSGELLPPKPHTE